MKTGICTLCARVDDTYLWPTCTGGGHYVCRPCLDRRPLSPKPPRSLGEIAVRILIGPLAIMAMPILIIIATAYLVGDLAWESFAYLTTRCASDTTQAEE